MIDLSTLIINASHARHKHETDIPQFFASTVKNEREYLMDVLCEPSPKKKEPVENPRDSGSTQGDSTAESLGWHESRWSRPALTQPNAA